MMHMVEHGKTLPKTLLKHDTSIHFPSHTKLAITVLKCCELNWTLVFTKHFLFLVECSSAESIVFSRIHSCLQHKVVTIQLIETQQIVAKHSNIWAASYYGNTIITFSSSYSMDIFDEINELPLVRGQVTSRCLKSRWYAIFLLHNSLSTIYLSFLSLLQ